MLRFEPAAAETLRAAIREAGGVEVFALGDVEAGHVTQVTVTCRGQVDRVSALLDRPRAGQIVVHNHPSGDLRASDADMQLAQLYGENGVGVVIVDNAVTRSNWVVEPYVSKLVPIDDALLETFFTVGLPAALPGWEARPQQLEMARKVAEALNNDRPLLCEAGTGTGKSLAYLVPAALWAVANDTKVVVSTFTKALQAQLVASDLPMLGRGGIAVRTAVLQGRNNYLCRRRLEIAAADEADPDRETLQALVAWSKSTADGSRSDLPLPVEVGTWEHVMSDADLTLSVRCPHYVDCHYYKARRSASGAHLIVVNHALLLTDLAVRDEAGRGFLPKYQRVILDEGHHLEDAATGVSTNKVNAGAVRRATFGMLDTSRRQGALTRLLASHTKDSSTLPHTARVDLSVAIGVAEQRLVSVQAGAPLSLSLLAETQLPNDDPRRITPTVEATDSWKDDLVPTLRHLGSEIDLATEALDAIEAVFADILLPEAEMQPLLDVRRARKRLVSHADVARAFVTGDTSTERCRWIEADRGRGERTAAFCAAPVEVAAVLRKILWGPFPGTVCTSATLTVGGRFEHYARRIGLDAVATEVIYPSPFDHFQQAILGLPRDLPSPEEPAFLAESGRVVAEAVRISDGGAFVLCTSHVAVRAYAEILRREAGDRPILAQGDLGRAILLDRFRDNRRAVLVGTDSFWEGVSVRGDGLRLVVIPRIPFRVPTEPLLEARHEKIVARGGDPFRSYSLPEAVLKLRQGYGRLIRSYTDRGVVLILDRRLHDKQYGQVVLRSLPPARRVTGPWKMVAEAVRAMLAP